MKEFIDILFPVDISYNAVSETAFKTNITILENGREQRNAAWQDARQSFSISKDNLTEQEAIELLKFYRQVGGELQTFRFFNWSDYKVSQEEGIANEDGFLNGSRYIELWKKYEFSIDYNFNARRIILIADDDYIDVIKFTCFIDNNELIRDTDYKIDFKHGIVTLKPLKSVTITNISKALNAVITTSTEHTFLTGEKVFITGLLNDNGLNNEVFTITKIDDFNFSIDFDTTNIVGTITAGTAEYYYQDEDLKFSWEGQFFNKVRFDGKMSITYATFNSQNVPFNLIEYPIFEAGE